MLQACALYSYNRRKWTIIAGDGVTWHDHTGVQAVQAPAVRGQRQHKVGSTTRANGAWVGAGDGGSNQRAACPNVDQTMVA